MGQSPLLYDQSAALALIEPWMREHLPPLEAGAAWHLIQLVTAIFEQQSVVLDEIADSSVFTASAESNLTQVRRIIRDGRITLEAVYYPLVQMWLQTLSVEMLYLTMDETSHSTDYQVFQLGLATDAISLPLAFLIYEPHAAWAEDARALLQVLDTVIPEQFDIVLLADRLHSGEPFLACLDALEWNYVFRAAEDTYIEHPRKGWIQLKQADKRANQGRYLNNVRVWKGGQRRTNVSIYKVVRNGFRPTTWYVLSNLRACKERFAEYACRWWQECLFKDLKSAMFEWERGRVTDPARVTVLLIGVSCAIWALWLLGRAHEHIPKRKATTTRPQQRRRSVLKQGWKAFRQAVQRRRSLTLPPPYAPRVVDYQRSFPATA